LNLRDAVARSTLLLTNVCCVVHERSVDTDILCLLCRRLLYTNDHVRLVLMSATMAANLYQEYFGAPEPPLVVGAKRYPVTEVFLEDLVSQQSTCKLSAKAKKTALQTLDECNKMKCIRTPSLSYMEKLFTIVTSLVATIAETGSSILIFVPGMNEIIGISELIEQQFVPGKRFTCIPVHSDIPFEDQMKVFGKSSKRSRPLPFHFFLHPSFPTLRCRSRGAR
jgi:HrpA-like RNA helicase